MAAAALQAVSCSVLPAEDACSGEWSVMGAPRGLTQELGVVLAKHRAGGAGIDVSFESSRAGWNPRRKRR